MIYIIHDKHNDLVKIGKTICPLERLRMFQTQHPWDLVIIRLMEGDKEEEKFLHQKWGHLRTKGEWFQFHPDMLSDKTFPDCDARQEITSIAIKVPNEMLAEIQALAKAERRTLAAMARLLIEDGLELARKHEGGNGE